MTNSEIRGQKFAEWVKANPIRGKAILYVIALIFFSFVGWISWHFIESVADRVTNGKVIGTIAMLVVILLRVRSFQKKRRSVDG